MASTIASLVMHPSMREHLPLIMSVTAKLNTLKAGDQKTLLLAFLELVTHFVSPEGEEAALVNDLQTRLASPQAVQVSKLVPQLATDERMQSYVGRVAKSITSRGTAGDPGPKEESSSQVCPGCGMVHD